MPTSDQIVGAKTILQAQLELQRLGNTKALSLLESNEPDLAEIVLENSTALYHQLLDVGASGKQARRIHEAALTLVLLCIRSVQNAHRALWQENMGQELIRKLTPPESPVAPPLA